MVSFKNLTLVAVFAAATSACDHKELCFDHPDHAPRYEVDVRASWILAWEIPYEGNTDWRSEWDDEVMGREYGSLNPVVPEGLRVVSYREGITVPDEINIPADGDTIGLQPGRQSLLFYNNDFEYVTIDNGDSYAQAMARTRSRSRLSYPRNDDEETVAPPDMLFGSWVDEYDNQAGDSPDIMNVEMHPLTFTYVIRYEFSHGIEYVGLARGALSGMAKGVYLHSGTNSETPVTLLYDCTVQEWGVEAVIKSFGLPGFPNVDYRRADSDFMLNLEVRLTNGKTFSFDVDVSGQVAAQPYGGVIVAGPFEISDEDGDGSGSGFQVDVTDWGDEQDVDLEI